MRRVIVILIVCDELVEERYVYDYAGDDKLKTFSSIRDTFAKILHSMCYQQNVEWRVEQNYEAKAARCLSQL